MYLESEILGKLFGVIRVLIVKIILDVYAYLNKFRFSPKTKVTNITKIIGRNENEWVQRSIFELLYSKSCIKNKIYIFQFKNLNITDQIFIVGPIYNN